MLTPGAFVMTKTTAEIWQEKREQLNVTPATYLDLDDVVNESTYVLIIGDIRSMRPGWDSYDMYYFALVEGKLRWVGEYALNV